MKKTAIIVFIFSLLSKIIGFGRDIALSYYFGTGNVSDAYIVCFTVPGVIFTFIGTGIATSFIPLFCEIQNLKGLDEANAFTNDITISLLLICSLLIAIGLFFTEPLVRLLATGFDTETMNMAIYFTRISLFGIYFSVMIHIFSNYLNLKNNFLIPALMGIPYNVFIFISIIIGSKVNVTYLPVGIIIALIAQYSLLYLYLKKEGYKFKLKFNFKNQYIRKFITLSLPVIIGVSIYEINIIVDRTIASKVISGGVSALNYASRLNFFVIGLFVLSIVTVIFPFVSNMATSGNIEVLKTTLSKTITSINIIVVPISLGMAILSRPVVSLLFGRGAFNNQSIDLTSQALFYFSFGMLGFGLREVLSRVFYSLQDTKTPMMNAGLALILNVILSIILSKIMGVAGIALSTSISAIVTTILLFMSLYYKIGSFHIKIIGIKFLKIFSASIIMSGFLYHFYNMSIFNNGITNLIISIFLGFIIYSILVWFLKIEEVKYLYFEILVRIKK